MLSGLPKEGADHQTEAYLTMLVRLDRAQEAVAYGQTHLAAPGEALALARALCEHGEREESLQIAEQGLTLDGRKAELAVWLHDQAEAMGQQETGTQGSRTGLSLAYEPGALSLRSKARRKAMGGAENGATRIRAHNSGI